MSAFDAEAEVAKWLESIRPDVEAALRELIVTPLPEGAAMLDFELHYDSNWPVFPIVCYPMDRSAGQCGIYEQFVEIAGLPPDVVSRAREEDSGVGLEEAMGRALFAWFPERWRAVDGPTSGVPAYLSSHEDIESLDLNTDKMIDSEEKWPE